MGALRLCDIIYNVNCTRSYETTTREAAHILQKMWYLAGQILETCMTGKEVHKEERAAEYDKIICAVEH